MLDNIINHFTQYSYQMKYILEQNLCVIKALYVIYDISSFSLIFHIIYEGFPNSLIQAQKLVGIILNLYRVLLGSASLFV